jgi:hypothetical protein
MVRFRPSAPRIIKNPASLLYREAGFLFENDHKTAARKPSHFQIHHNGKLTACGIGAVKSMGFNTDELSWRLDYLMKDPALTKPGHQQK